MLFLPFNLTPKPIERLTNYELSLLPNGLYRSRQIVADNYLYPMYALKEESHFIVSTSVYALIHYKRRFVRNPKFQTTHFYRPSFLTIDEEINRVRTIHRRSTCELTNPERIIALGVDILQDYVTKIEQRFPDHVHILLMGGKDSENIILAKRQARWIVLSGAPNALLNQRFIEDNRIPIANFVSVTNETDDSTLLLEILASDCFFDVAHFRWTRAIRDLVQAHNGRAVIWMGSSGDGTFSKNNNHRDVDYYAVHDLHVGMAMGVWHQMLKNFLNVPVVSPYQSPDFLDKLFYRFDPYFVLQAGDVRAAMGERLLGRPVSYPQINPCPATWSRNRKRSIPIYTQQLKEDGMPCENRTIESWMCDKQEQTFCLLDAYSSKRRGSLSKILVPLRTRLSTCFPALGNRRHNISAREIT